MQPFVFVNDMADLKIKNVVVVSNRPMNFLCAEIDQKLLFSCYFFSSNSIHILTVRFKVKSVLV